MFFSLYPTDPDDNTYIKVRTAYTLDPIPCTFTLLATSASTFFGNAIVEWLLDPVPESEVDALLLVNGYV